MEPKKEYACGSKIVDVSTSTEIIISCITDYDSAKFISAQWPTPPYPKYDYKFWDAVCTEIQQSVDVRKRVLAAFQTKCLSVCRSAINKIELAHVESKHYQAYREFAVSMGRPQLTDLNRVDDRPDAKYIEATMWVNGTPQKFELDYPCNYNLILTTLAQYVADEWNKAEVIATNKRFGKKIPQLSGSAKNIEDILCEYKTYIDEFMARVTDINDREENPEYMKYKNGTRVLCVGAQRFFDDSCGFDIDKAYSEICEIKQKLINSQNLGESSVEYALKWIMAAHDGDIVSIKGDCESKHRYNCIVLCKPDFIDEPQEYDHILVCPGGVVLIETKHWKGHVEIRPDGKWIRKIDGEGSSIGIDSPKFQMRRHEVVMQQILPSVQVNSLLCFSNATTIIDGRENFKDYPIITIDQLEETLADLCALGTYSKEDIERIVATIEAHKTNRMK